MRTTIRCGACKTSQRAIVDKGSALLRCETCHHEQIVIVPVAGARFPELARTERTAVLDLKSQPMFQLRARLKELDLLRMEIARGKLDGIPVVFAGASKPPRGWHLLSKFSWNRRRSVSRACALEHEMIAAEIQRRGEAWDAFHSDKEQIKVLGDSFERFIGRGYEAMGYSVQYPGLGVADGGIDLICENVTEVLVVQCKYYSMSRQVQLPTLLELHESHGRFTSLRLPAQRAAPSLPSDGYFSMPGVGRSRQVTEKDVKPVLATTSILTAAARSFAAQMGIIIREGVDFREDPHLW